VPLYVTGHGTNIIAGVGVGMEATCAPVLVISAAIISAYWVGQSAGLTDAATGLPTGGLFGTAVATMGMLSTAAYVLTMDVFGPIADNAGGIVEMSEQPESVRNITDVLDSVGNTTKATTKGYAIGSAALASFLLFSAYMDEVESFTGRVGTPGCQIGYVDHAGCHQAVLRLQNYVKSVCVCVR
jgi:Na+/H+-translocating membrane pyrophosphatase